MQSLDTNNAKLLSVTPGTDLMPDRAVVWLPYGAVGQFFRKIEEFATQTTSTGKPKNESLIANIGNLRLALLRDVWQEPEQFPEVDEVRWWEVWLARLESGRRISGRGKGNPEFATDVPVRDPAAILRGVATGFGWRVVAEMLTLPEHVVALVQASASELSALLGTSAVPSELHRVRVASVLPHGDHSFMTELARDLADRIEAAGPDSAAVCVLDTGIRGEHPLLRASADHALSALDNSGPGDAAGHGTEMAGLALFGDLEGVLAQNGAVKLRHRVESVKILQENQDTSTTREMYPVIAARAVSEVEIARQRRRVFSMAVTVDDPEGSNGRPTSYSVALDALSFGTDIRATPSGVELLGHPDPEAARLYLVSAGNIRGGYAVNHLDLSDLTKVQNPAQAWNALTVGAYTEMTETPDDPKFSGWTAMAPAGELSPLSRTSVPWESWPVKPDIVLEGGNVLVSPAGTAFDWHDVVSVPTTSNNEFRLLTTTNATSAATAQAARLAAIAREQYPSLWPETARGLLVHAAAWTPAMQAHFKAAGDSKGKRIKLLRRYGWGVPTEERVLSSLSNSVTLLVQDEFLPFEMVRSGVAMRAFRQHRLPWPQEQLRDLFDAKVRLRVTLSYFIEPNPSSRGWQGKYRYASHGLRFDVKRPAETLEEFQRRLNNTAAQEETDSGAPSRSSTDDRWYIGSRGRNSGSLHGDIWTGTGAQLADSGYIGVTPVGGWWKDNARSDRVGLPVRYALLVSLHTDATATDIYTPIANQIGIPVPIVG